MITKRSLVFQRRVVADAEDGNNLRAHLVYPFMNNERGSVSAISGRLPHRLALWGIVVMLLMTVSAQAAAAQSATVAATDADRVTVPLMEVRRIQVRDSLTNGALIGALIGGGISAWAGITLDRDCDGQCGNWGAITRFIAVGAGAGALAGMGIDAVIRREIKPSPWTSRSVAVVPALWKTHRAVRLVVRW